jgi:hypothetical protein
MQFFVFVDGKMLGQMEIADDLALDRLLSQFPQATLKTTAQVLDEGWR